MVKTESYIVCDKCQKKFNPFDKIFGYCKIQNRYSLTYGSKDYREYFFDEECYSQIKKETIERLKSTIVKMIIDRNVKSFSFYIPHIDESYSVKYMDYDEIDAWYFSIEVEGINQLFKICKYVTDFDYSAICVDNAVALMFRNIKEGRLDKLQEKFEEDYRARVIASQVAQSAACSAIDLSSIEGVVTTLC